MNIVLTGSLGHIGKPLTETLVGQGPRVTVVSHSEDRAKDIESLGATAAIGSVDDAEFLARTFSGADAVFLMVPPNFGVPDMMAYYKAVGAAYADAVQQAGVKRVVVLSSYGAHLTEGSGFILGAHHVENIMNEVPGISLTHLRPGYFYYNLNNFIGMIKGAGFIGTNFGGEDKLALVAPADIAAAAAEELARPSGEKVRYIVSDERTATDVARVLGEAIGKPGMEWKTLTDEQTRGGMEGAGLSPHIASLFMNLGARIHDGSLLEDYEKHRPVQVGRVKLEDFAEEFAQAFRGDGDGGH